MRKKIGAALCFFVIGIIIWSFVSSFKKEQPCEHVWVWVAARGGWKKQPSTLFFNQDMVCVKCLKIDTLPFYGTLSTQIQQQKP